MVQLDFIIPEEKKKECISVKHCCFAMGYEACQNCPPILTTKKQRHAASAFSCIYPHISRISQAMPPLSNTSTSAHVRRRPAPAVPGFITFTPPISS